MAQDVSGSIDHSDLVDGQPIDAADADNPISDIIGVLNDTLNGVQPFDQINFSAATELTIASGVVTVTKSMHTIDTEGDAASDDLDTITMAEGDVAWLRAANTARTVVLKHGTGNILTATGADVSLDDTDRVVCAVRFGSDVLILDTAEYTPDDTTDWGGSDPGDVPAALDWLAARMVGRGYIVGLEINVTSDSSLTISEGECLDASHEKLMRLGGGTYVVTTSGTGAGHLDAGSIASDTWYYVWLIKGTSGVAALISTSSSAPTLPSGYDDYKRWIGMVRTDGSGNLYHQYMIPGSGNCRRVRWLEDTTTGDFQVLNAADVSQSPTWDTVDLSAVVPPTARVAYLEMECGAPSGNTRIYCRRDSTGGQATVLLESSGGRGAVWVEVILTSSQTFQIAASGAVTDNVTANVLGYTDNLLPDLA